MKNFTLLLVFVIFIANNMFGQLNETEPNDNFNNANPLPINTVMQGVTCAAPAVDYFRIFIPYDGVLKIHSSCVANGSVIPNDFIFQIYTNMYGGISNYLPGVGTGTNPVVDSFSLNCVKSDTFYISIHSSSNSISYCYGYEFSFEVIPAYFNVETEPNNNPSEAINLPINTDIEGHLGFKDESSTGNGEDGNDYYRCVIPDDGIVRVYTAAENVGVATNPVNIYLSDKSGISAIAVLPMPVGSYGLPQLDTLLFDCIPSDTFYIWVNLNNATDCGISYKLRYDLIAPPFSNDIEPNNDFQHVIQVAPGDQVEGHLRYELNSGDIYDYYKLYYPDSSFLRIFSDVSINGGGPQQFVIEAFGQVSGLNGNYYALVGLNGTIGHDSTFFYPNMPDSITVRVSFTTNQCGAYSLRFITPSTTGIESYAIPNKFNVYPNPAHSSIYIQLQKSDQWIKLYSLQGQCIYQEELKKFTANQPKEIDLSYLPKGIYLLKVEGKDGNKVGKVIKQ